jgi:hypothetical protein
MVSLTNMIQVGHPSWSHYIDSINNTVCISCVMYPKSVINNGPQMIQFCVWKHSVVLHDNYDSHSNVRQDYGLLRQGDMQLSTMCRTNLLPLSSDCSPLDRESRFLQPYQFTGHHIFIRTRFLAVYKCRPRTESITTADPHRWNIQNIV